MSNSFHTQSKGIQTYLKHIHKQFCLLVFVFCFIRHAYTTSNIYYVCGWFIWNISILLNKIVFYIFKNMHQDESTRTKIRDSWKKAIKRWISQSNEIYHYENFESKIAYKLFTEQTVSLHKSHNINTQFKPPNSNLFLHSFILDSCKSRCNFKLEKKNKTPKFERKKRVYNAISNIYLCVNMFTNLSLRK